MFQMIHSHFNIRKWLYGRNLERYTKCPECHFQEDFGLNSKLYEKKIENYLKGIYGANWSKENLIYKKY